MILFRGYVQKSGIKKEVSFVEHFLFRRPHPVGNANLWKIKSRRLGGDFKTEMRAYPVIEYKKRD